MWTRQKSFHELPVDITDREHRGGNAGDLLARLLVKCAIVVKCGAVSPQTAMNVTCARQAPSIPRLPTIPCE